jgi:hypothetical protein
MPWRRTRPPPVSRCRPGTCHCRARRTAPAAGACRTARPWSDPDAWAENLPYRYGWRLYEEGFYWEAHEVWEAVWLACAPQSRERLLLQALIQLTNARLKAVMGQEKAVARLLAEVDRLRAEPGLQDAPVMAVSKERLAQLVSEIKTEHA